ncbi:MAG: VWA containing CoxE family protein [Planctomycetota bacterium]|nr:MAG: VWA containing CoxE family protein [Planctomycetota bacterium]
MSSHARDRWKLVLGRFAEDALGGASPGAERMARALDFLYSREYRGRQTRSGKDGDSRTGGREASRLTVPDWIREVQELFPRDCCETITKHALERYEMTELVCDPKILEALEPDYELLRSILVFRHMMSAPVLEMARRIVRQVVDQLRRELETQVRRTLLGRPNRTQRSQQKLARNLDLARTLRSSLKHYDPEARRLRAVDLRFFARQQRHFAWDVILCVDCSGSMLDSVIHSSVMAGIFHGMPSLRCRLIAFDTSVLDLSEHVADPVELLMSIQLGGGTDIAGAMAHCAKLVEQPTRTMLVLVTDFYEGGNPAQLLATIKSLHGSGVKVFGLAALDARAQPVYDHGLAGECAAAGADVAALTPQRLSEWMSRAMR